MIATARVAAGPQARLAPAEREAVDRLARWLLVAVGFDLIVTRFVVRLAIFIPKGEPWATASAILGRIGAATDALVPIVGLLLLGALLLRAGRLGDRAEQTILVLIAAIAVGGLALVRLPPTPLVALGLDLLVAVVAVGAALRIGRDVHAPRVARLGIVSLAAAIALAALGRMVDLAAVVAAPEGASPSGTPGIAIGALGQLAFVAGAALVGLAGVAGLVSPGAPRRGLAIGLAAALVVLALGLRAPAIWGALAIWSVGLAGIVPVPAIALAIGLAVAGLPALHRRTPASAIGASIVLLAGYGLAASGLALAGLLGLVVASAKREHLIASSS